MAITKPITTTQPQIAQLEVQFNGPLTTESQVDSINDLLLLNLKWNYPHKIVWVKDKKSNYYLDNGDGSELVNWKRAIGRMVVDRYDPAETYQKGDVVHLSGKIYSAKQDVPKEKNPIDFPEYWLVIAGDTETYRYMFQETTSTIIYTDIRNPLIQVFIGDLILNPNGTPLLDETGYIQISEDLMEVSPFIRRRKDIPNNMGQAYEISFIENSEYPANQATKYSGYINIK